MKEIVALQELVESEEKRITFARRQLSDHESGANKLSAMIHASTETKLEDSLELLEKHQSMLDELLKQDIEELEEQERLKEAVQRKNYYKYQKVRLKRDTVRSNDEKLEALMIVDELPDGVNFEDKEIFEIAEQTIGLNLRVHEELDNTLKEITKKFQDLIKNCEEENVRELVTLNSLIPILVLHFSVLLSNIKENIEENNLPEFRGFPRFEDWWIEELWESHQAYLGLYKWKSIITGLCITSDQTRAWEVIFSNWIFVKKMLNGKGRLGFNYNFAFDSLIRKYAELEEEISSPNLLAMDTIIQKLTARIDFNTVSSEHNMVTSYLEYKRSKLNYSDN